MERKISCFHDFNTIHPDERFSNKQQIVMLLRLDQIYIYIYTNFSTRISYYEFLVLINSTKNK